MTDRVRVRAAVADAALEPRPRDWPIAALGVVAIAVLSTIAIAHAAPAYYERYAPGVYPLDRVLQFAGYVWAETLGLVLVLRMRGDVPVWFRAFTIGMLGGFASLVLGAAAMHAGGVVIGWVGWHILTAGWLIGYALLAGVAGIVRRLVG